MTHAIFTPADIEAVTKAAEGMRRGGQVLLTLHHDDHCPALVSGCIEDCRCNPSLSAVTDVADGSATTSRAIDAAWLEAAQRHRAREDAAAAIARAASQNRNRKARRAAERAARRAARRNP